MLFKYLTFLLSLFFVAATAAPTSGDAIVINDKIEGNNQTYTANFEYSATSIVSGSIGFKPSGDGVGVTINMKLSISDSSLGPFAYHIHSQRVTDDGNCTATSAHFDPYKPANPRAACDPGNPVACEIGDLSGKHTRIPQFPSGSIMIQSEFKDQYLSLDPGNVAFIGNRSIVIHNSINSTRIACSNLKA